MSNIRTLTTEMSKLPRCHTLNDTHNFLLELERITRELKTMGEDIDSPLVHIPLEQKLPPNFLRTILLKKQEDPDQWTTTMFIKTLNDAVRRETSIRKVLDDYGHKKGPSGRSNQNQKRKSGNREHTLINSTVDATKADKPVLKL